MKLSLSALCMSLLTFFAVTNTFAYEDKYLKGFWAMKPLVNGIANVDYYDGNNKNTLYIFTCDFNHKTSSSNEEPEEADYHVKDGIIYLNYPELGKEFKREFKIKALSKNNLVLEEEVLPEIVLTFEYERVDSVKNLCPTN